MTINVHNLPEGLTPSQIIQALVLRNAKKPNCTGKCLREPSCKGSACIFFVSSQIGCTLGKAVLRGADTYIL